MCVRDLTRGKCQASRRTTSKLISRHSAKVLSSKTSTSRRARRMRKREEVDLLCTELLSQSDAHSYHPEISYFKLEYEPLSPLMTGIPSTSCAAMDPFVYSLLLSPASDYCNCFQQRPWSGIQGVSPPLFGYGEETSAVVAADRNWNDGGLIDGLDWHDFSPDRRFNLPSAKQNGWRYVQTETFLPLGSSLQSNDLPGEKWHVPARGPSCNDKERRSIESMANSPSREKLGFSDPTETFYSLPSVIDHERANLSDRGRICATKGHRCKAEFLETMDFLLEKESAANYQLSTAYIERLTSHSNGWRGVRRSFVNWILKVVELLHLSSLTAAHAVSLFDRSLSQLSDLDAQDGENEELLLAATACVWIAAKLEDSGAPHLSCMRALAAVNYDEEKIRKMEVLVLSSLGWRILRVTSADFLANMIAELPTLGLPADLLTPLAYRSEEIMRVLFQEVEFLAYQPSVVSFSVMQCLLDEHVPVHTADLMAAFHLALAVDVESKENCYQTLMDLVVDASQVSLSQSSSRGFVNFKYNYLHSDPLQEQNRRLSIPAF